MILLIGDDMPMMRVMSWVLLEQKYEVAHADDPEEAMERLRDLHLQPDVIVYDGALDEVTHQGPQGLAELAPDARVLALLEHEPKSTKRELRDATYLHKPFHADTLVETVAQLVAVA